MHLGRHAFFIFASILLGCDEGAEKQATAAPDSLAATASPREPDTLVAAAGSGSEWRQVAGDDANTRFSTLD